MFRKDFQFKFNIVRFYFKTFNIELTLNKFNISYNFLVGLVNKYNTYGIEGLKSVYDKFPTQLRLSAIIDKFIWNKSDKELVEKYKVPSISYIYSWFNQYNNKYDTTNNNTTDTIQEILSMDSTKKQPIEERLSYKLRFKDGKVDLNSLTEEQVRQSILEYSPKFKRKYDIIQDYLKYGFTEAKKKYANELKDYQFKDLVQTYKSKGYPGLFDTREDEQRELKSLWQMPLEELTAYDLEVMLLLTVMEKELIKKYRSMNLTTQK